MNGIETLERRNQYGGNDYYAMVCVIDVDNDEVHVFNTEDARRDAWAYRDKHGGVVMITLKSKSGGKVKVFPDRHPDNEMKGGRNEEAYCKRTL